MLIVEDLLESDIINLETSRKLKVGVAYEEVKLKEKFRESIRFFFTSFVGLSQSQIDRIAYKDFLDDLPSLTQLIPSYGEAVIFDINYLINTDKKSLSNLEFLSRKYPDEWKNMFERISRRYGDHVNDTFRLRGASSPSDLLSQFLHRTSSLKQEVIEEIRIWASARGQVRASLC